MKRRTALAASIVSALAMARTQPIQAHDQQLASGDMTFAWDHQANRLHGHLTAPAPGWLAVGFNDRQQLVGTRFVMAIVAKDGHVQIQERVAIPTGHDLVINRGGETQLDDVSGQRIAEISHLTFSLPHQFDDRHHVSLAPGTTSYLMLAWAHQPDFTHHSAWRHHKNTEL
ncbi:MAG: DOMON domain-containing protein [Pseudomonadota bacterium]